MSRKTNVSVVCRDVCRCAVCVCVYVRYVYVINSSLAVYHHSYFACRTNKTNNNSGNKSRELFGLLTLSRESCLWFALFPVCLSVCVCCICKAALIEIQNKSTTTTYSSYSSFSLRTYFLPSHAVGSIDLIVIVYLVRMQSMQANAHTHTH